jgi:tetrapyrrole methylase family protein/MazG family protein
MKIWSNVKKNVEGREDHSEDDLFSNIPKSEPLVEQAYQIQKKLENLGFDWKDQKGVYDKVIEELEEVRTADNEQDREMEIGDLLFTVINLSRFYKIHPETALYRNTQKVKKRFNLLMKICKERNIELKTENADQMNEVWNEIKKLEH